MSDYLVLRPGSASAATGAKRTPFFTYISVGGLGVTFNLAADYSGVNSDAMWVAPKDAVITMLTIGIGDGSVAANASLSSRFVPDGASSIINMAIRTPALATIQDIFVNGVPTLNHCGLSCIASNSTIVFSPFGGATAANNEAITVVYIDFVKKCGGGIFVKAGNNLGFPLTSNWSTAANVLFAVSGFFRG